MGDGFCGGGLAEGRDVGKVSFAYQRTKNMSNDFHCHGATACDQVTDCSYF